MEHKKTIYLSVGFVEKCAHNNRGIGTLLQTSDTENPKTHFTLHPPHTV